MYPVHVEPVTTFEIHCGDSYIVEAPECVHDDGDDVGFQKVVAGKEKSRSRSDAGGTTLLDDSAGPSDWQ